jgi:hypothetical protein
LVTFNLLYTANAARSSKPDLHARRNRPAHRIAHHSTQPAGKFARPIASGRMGMELYVVINNVKLAFMHVFDS